MNERMIHSSPTAPWRLVVVLCLAALAGCAFGPRLVRTEVTSFNQWEALPVDKTYTFARTLEYKDSLEVQAYEALVRDELGIQGFRFVPDGAQANLVVTLRPSVTGTNLRVDPWPTVHPYFGRLRYFDQSGWGGSYWGGYGGGFGSYYGFNDYSIQVFQRRLEIDIDSRATAGKRYYEGRVENVGESDSLPRIMPALVRALFTDFPGNNGQTRRVDVPVLPVPTTKS